MPVKKLREFLVGENVKYVLLCHSAAFTAQEIAAKAHIPGKELAKTVIVSIDGEMAMAVLPASYKVDFTSLKEMAGAGRVDLCDEKDFRNKFPGCELGAMPPFGNLYDMRVFVDETLAEDDEIAFNAGSHTELVRMAYKDFERLVQPTVVSFGAKTLTG
ncbi:MAG: YbaK/EbsC family protein [Acidobacteriota bacterium]|nr:YbaK/EbsC family protein [Acidobacteriota bacterium]